MTAYNQLIASGENKLDFDNDLDLVEIIQKKEAEQQAKEKKKQMGLKSLTTMFSKNMSLLTSDIKG